MSLYKQLLAIRSNVSRSAQRLGFLRGFPAYLYTVAVRKCPVGKGRLVSLPVPRDSARLLARLGTHDAAAFRQIYLTGDYDFPLSEVPGVIVDAGAHVGYGAAFFAGRYPGARVYSLEPEPSNISVLKQNTAAYPNITVIEAALWNSEGEVSITDPGADVWSFRVKELSPGGQAGHRVKAMTITQIIERVGHIDLFKIDIEGAEIELFSGNTDWLNQVGCIVIELHDEHRHGCSDAFYGAIAGRNYSEERLGENLVIRFQAPSGN